MTARPGQVVVSAQSCQAGRNNNLPGTSHIILNELTLSTDRTEKEERLARRMAEHHGGDESAGLLDGVDNDGRQLRLHAAPRL